MKTLVSTESIILAIICMADMFSTLLFVSLGHATEQNPLMAACLKHSAMMFIVAKTASFLPFIVVVEWYRRQKPQFARNATRAAIILYLLAYMTITARVNMV